MLHVASPDIGRQATAVANVAMMTAVAEFLINVASYDVRRTRDPARCGLAAAAVRNFRTCHQTTEMAITSGSRVRGGGYSRRTPSNDGRKRDTIEIGSLSISRLYRTAPAPRQAPCYACRKASVEIERMPKFKMLSPGGWGEKNLRDYSYSMVMEVDGRVELSGQGGWDPATLEFPTRHAIEAEINQAFDNVEFMLKAVGLDWRNVGHVNSYHVPEPDGTILAANAEMGRQFRLRMPDHKPIWTCLGVAVLGDPKMRVEIRVTAFRD